MMAAVHRLVLAGDAPELAPYFPSVGGMEPPGRAGDVFIGVVERLPGRIREHLRLPIQTNEVGRCRALVGGFLTFASESGMPFRILELGASAGLNLRWDDYRYEGSSCSWGPIDSPVRLPWRISDGSPPLDAAVRVVGRRGCDLMPIDPGSEAGRLRLLSFAWADQLERFERLRVALEWAPRTPAPVDTAEAGAWLEPHLAGVTVGIGTVVFQSIVRQFLSTRQRTRIERIIERAGDRATAGAPLAWLRMEAGSEPQRHEVRMTMWPGGRDRLLAVTDLFGESVTWLGR
jgi:hypothetical protein